MEEEKRLAELKKIPLEIHDLLFDENDAMRSSSDLKQCQNSSQFVRRLDREGDPIGNYADEWSIIDKMRFTHDKWVSV